MKGVPVLFIQAECEYQFKKMGMEQKAADTLAGIMGGIGQGKDHFQKTFYSC